MLSYLNYTLKHFSTILSDSVLLSKSYVSTDSNNINFSIPRVTWVYQDQEVPLDNKDPQYVLKAFLVIMTFKKLMLIYLIWSLIHMWFLFWFPKGWARWPGWTRTKRRKRIWSKLKLFKAIWNSLLAWESKGIGVAVHCNLNDHSSFQSKITVGFCTGCSSVIVLKHDYWLFYVFWLQYKFPFTGNLLWLCENCLSLSQTNCIPLGFQAEIPTSLKISIAEGKCISHTYLVVVVI